MTRSHDLRERRVARRELLAFEQRHASHDMRRSQMNMDRRPVLEGLRFGGEQAQPDIDSVRRRVELRTHHPIAPLDRFLGEPGAGEIERTAFAGASHRGGPVLGMQRAHPGLDAGRGQQQPVVDPDLAGMDSAGDDDARSGQDEAAIHCKACEARSALTAFAQYQELFLQFVDALPRHRRDGHDFRAPQRGRGEQGLDLGHPLELLVVVGEVGLGEGHDAAIEAQQVEDLQMLDRLRLDAFGRRHDQQGRIDAGGAGQHVVHEPLVTGYVDEAELAAVAEIAVGITEVDGYAARLLLLEAIGVDTGQRLHQSGLAVIDMARGSDDHDKGSSARRSASARCEGLAWARASLKKPAASSPAPPISARRNQCSASTRSRSTPLPAR